MNRASASVEICILAGGMSSRMGKNKASVRIGRRTMMSIITAEAENTGLPVRVLRRDRIERCGPLGGIFTALESTRSEAVMFLACDMPLVTTGFIREILHQFTGRPLFVLSESAGFPCVLARDALTLVRQQINAREYSLHRLCDRVRGTLIPPTSVQAQMLFNVNTPEDLAWVREKFQTLRLLTIDESR